MRDQIVLVRTKWAYSPTGQGKKKAVVGLTVFRDLLITSNTVSPDVPACLRA